MNNKFQDIPAKPLNQDIENRFTYHAPNAEQIKKYPLIRDEAKYLAYLIEENVPNGREKSLAMTKLEEVVMWANAGISRCGENENKG